MNETYSELFFKLLNRIETKLYDKVNFKGIPNMNVVYVNNFKTFAEACELTLKHYYAYTNKRTLTQTQLFLETYFYFLSSSLVLRQSYP